MQFKTLEVCKSSKRNVSVYVWTQNKVGGGKVSCKYLFKTATVNR